MLSSSLKTPNYLSSLIYSPDYYVIAPCSIFVSTPPNHSLTYSLHSAIFNSFIILFLFQLSLFIIYYTSTSVLVFSAFLTHHYSSSFFFFTNLSLLFFLYSCIPLLSVFLCYIFEVILFLARLRQIMKVNFYEARAHRHEKLTP